MSYHEIKEYAYRCDCCGKVVRSETRPDGWARVSVGPCGLTDYYRTDDHCEVCVARASSEAPRP